MKHWSFSIFFIQHSSISTYRSSPHVTLWEVNVFCHFFCLLHVGSPSRKAAALCLQSSFPALWIAARKVTEDFASGCCCFLVLGGSFVNRNSTDWDQGLKSLLWVTPACYQLNNWHLLLVLQSVTNILLWCIRWCRLVWIPSSEQSLLIFHCCVRHPHFKGHRFCDNTWRGGLAILPRHLLNAFIRMQYWVHSPAGDKDMLCL